MKPNKIELIWLTVQNYSFTQIEDVKLFWHKGCQNEAEIKIINKENEQD